MSAPPRSREPASKRPLGGDGAAGAAGPPELPPEKGPHVHSQPILLQDLPPAFLSWLTENEIDPRVYTESHKLPRYIRLNPRSTGGAPTAQQLAAQLGAELRPVEWLKGPAAGGGWYALDSQHTIAGTAAYKRGLIYGMDASSAAAVLALGCQPGNHILDLCCAPAAKLCLMADQLYCAARGTENGSGSASSGGGATGSITGVDISADRLNVARKVLNKYGLLRPNASTQESGPGALAAGRTPPIRLLLADGLHFAAPPPQHALWCGDALASTVQGGGCGQPVVASPPLPAADSGYVDVTWGSGAHVQPNSWRARKLRKKQRRQQQRQQHQEAVAAAETGGTATGKMQGGRRHEAVVTSAGEAVYIAAPAAPAQAAARVAAAPTWYDRVLVDAQCTHDGSVKHIAKYATQWGWESFGRRAFGAASAGPNVELEDEQAAATELQDTQRGLLRQGFRMLKPLPTEAASDALIGALLAEAQQSDDMEAAVAAGTAAAQTAEWPCLVYATCSLSVAQNEAVVQWLLDLEPSAKLVPIWLPPDGQSAAGAGWEPAQSRWPCLTGRGTLVGRALRFDPATSGTGGLFVAKIVKTGSG